MQPHDALPGTGDDSSKEIPAVWRHRPLRIWPRPCQGFASIDIRPSESLEETCWTPCIHGQERWKLTCAYWTLGWTPPGKGWKRAQNRDSWLAACCGNGAFHRQRWWIMQRCISSVAGFSWQVVCTVLCLLNSLCFSQDGQKNSCLGKDCLLFFWLTYGRAH